MMQSYYDSDDDVCWGPVTLPELKYYAMQTRSKEDINLRRSIHCDPSFLDDLEKRAEEIAEIEAPPMRTANARRSSLPSMNKESDKRAGKETCRKKMNDTPILISDDDSFMEDSLDSRTSFQEDCNPNDSNSSGSVVFEGAVSVNNEIDCTGDEEDSLIELSQENITIDSSRSDEIGVSRDLKELNVTDPLCSDDIISIDLSTIEMNEQTNEVAPSQIVILGELEIQDTGEKIGQMSDNTFIRDIVEVLHINENILDESNVNAIDTYGRVEVSIDGELNELNIPASPCSDDVIDLTTAEENGLDNELSFKIIRDVASAQIAPLVKESEVQITTEKIDLMSANTFIRNIAEVLKLNEKILDKTNVNANETCSRVEIGIDRDITELNITTPHCNDVMSIDLSTSEMDDKEVSSEHIYDVVHEQIVRAKEHQLQISSEKTELMHGNTIENTTEIFDGLVTDLNEPNATTTEMNEQDNIVSSECVCDDAYVEINVVKQLEIQNDSKKTELINNSYIMEGLNFERNLCVKSNVKPCLSPYLEIGNSGTIPFNTSYNKKNLKSCNTSSHDGIMLKLNASNMSKDNSSTRRYYDDLSILNVEKLDDMFPPDHVNMTQQFNIDDIECMIVSNKKTKCADSLLRSEHEHSLKEKEENLNNDSSSQNVSKLSSRCMQEEKFDISSLPKIDASLKQNEFISSQNMFERDYSTSEDNCPVETDLVEDLSAHDYDLDDSLDKNPNTNAETSKNFTTQSSENDTSDSLHFNDTFDEIERVLEKGTNYSVSSPNSSKSTNVEPTSKKNTVVESTPSSKKFLTTNSSETASSKKFTGKYNNILSPVAAYITSSIPRPCNSQFKLPVKPIKPKVSPSVKNKYKCLASPVGVYINNAPTTPMYEKVTPTKSVQKQTKICLLEKLGNKENLLESFPEVMYKPAQHTIMRKENEKHLPKKIENLLPIKSSVTKHEARTVNDNSSVSRKLLEDDLTLNTTDNFFDMSSQDTSIRSKKRIYVSKFPVFKG